MPLSLMLVYSSWLLNSAYLTLLLISDASMDSPFLLHPPTDSLCGVSLIQRHQLRYVSCKKVDFFSRFNKYWSSLKNHKWISSRVPTRRFLQRCLDCFISAWILVPDKFSFSCQYLQCCRQDQMQDLSDQTNKEAGTLPFLFTYKDQAFTNYVLTLSGG